MIKNLFKKKTKFAKGVLDKPISTITTEEEMDKNLAKNQETMKAKSGLERFKEKYK